MPRSERLIVPDGIYHVTSHAVAAEPMLCDRIDAACYLDRLATAVARFEWGCLGYCLLGTHVHLLLRPAGGDLAPGMRWLHSTYVRTFNKRHFRRGPLLDGRYDAVLVETESHLLEVVRYVARNPVEAPVCARPEDWQWSSYGATVGIREPLPLLDVTGVLELFHPDRDEAVRQVREFVDGPRERLRLAA